MIVKLCKDCKWSIVDPTSPWQLLCANVEVNRKDPWVLSSSKASGTNSRTERKGRWFAVCGMVGKKWELKDANSRN